jgi:hypothetical protein
MPIAILVSIQGQFANVKGKSDILIGQNNDDCHLSYNPWAICYVKGKPEILIGQNNANCHLNFSPALSATIHATQ